MEYVTNRIDISPSIRSDHSLLVLGISLEKEHKRGKGLWKLNVCLLNDSSYVQHIKETIKHAISDTINLNDNFLAWDYIKCRIEQNLLHIQ